MTQHMSFNCIQHMSFNCIVNRSLSSTFRPWNEASKPIKASLLLNMPSILRTFGHFWFGSHNSTGDPNGVDMAIGINHIHMALARTNLPCLRAMAVGSDAQLVVPTRVAPASARVLVAQSFSMLKCTGCLAAKVMNADVLPTTTSIMSGTVLSTMGQSAGLGAAVMH